jgi:hypothetical protein
MHLIYLLLTSLFVLVKGAPLACPSSSLLYSLGLPEDATGATAFSLLYGSPLLQFNQSTTELLGAGKPNILHAQNGTATAAVRIVVRPNVDTIYSEGVFDLAATDLVFTLPPMEDDRFYMASFYDP